MKMKIKINIILFSILLVLTSCISTKNTIKNIDDNAPDLTLKKDNTFLITEYSKNPKVKMRTHYAF
jgi:PBP1b-binding outer membrane lipoprotein LpoB